MEDLFLSVENLGVSIGGQPILRGISLLMRPGEQWAITGASGSGKTVFGHTLCGRHFFTGKIEACFGSPETFLRKVGIVEQQHRFRDLANRSDFYYQQRYNSFDAEQTITVEEDLGSYFSGKGNLPSGLTKDALLELLQISHLLKEPLIQLSNGENKRLQLVKALLQDRELLILDQPFTGLDAKGREILSAVLSALDAKGVLLLLISPPRQIPDYITHVALLEKGSMRAALSKKDFFARSWPEMNHLPAIRAEQLEALFITGDCDFEYAIKMKDVNIHYGDRQVLQRLNWEVRKGEKWSVSGPNGAGKSTLLSLVTGDHPQAYANEIYLFDRRRGSGESIWDIKKRTGYVSPELHLYFEPSATCYQAIASGFFDTIGLFRLLSQKQEELVVGWMELLQLLEIQHKSLSQLSTGQQRLVLLARALVKNPPLLILDEPCQGLDEEQTAYFRSLIDLYCSTCPTTLIYVSHYREEMPDCIDHFLKLENGMVS
jgi:molybdate transport system ATP-binding protein